MQWRPCWKWLVKWHSLKAHISLTWQNFVSRSFPNACLVQSSMRGATLAWHQVNPLVIAGVSLLWRGSLLPSQTGFGSACQENFKIWNVTEKKVAASFNCLLSVQTVAFHIFMQRLHIAQCENRVKKRGKWVCICLQLSTVLSAKLWPRWSDWRSVWEPEVVESSCYGCKLNK